jgi:recombination protein RecA
MRTGAETQMSNKFEEFFKSFAEADATINFQFADAVGTEKIEVIQTGSYALDNALGAGGWPRGRIIQAYGPAGSGKSLMAMLGIVEAQKKDPTANQLFIDAEGTFDPIWAKSLGVDGSKLMLVREEMAVNGRMCFEMLLGSPKEDARTHAYAGKKTEGLLDKIANSEFNINFIVLDSLGSIIPPGEDVSDIGKMNMALLSRFLTPTFRKLSLEVSKAKVPFLIINHQKASMSMYGSDHAFSGGNSYTHFLSASVYFEAVGRKDAQILDDKENKIGHTMRASVEKSKFCPSPRKCEFKVNFGIGVVDKHNEIAQLALDYGVVDQAAKTYSYGDYKWIGAQKFADALAENKALADEILQKVAEARENKSKPLDTPKTSDILDGETTSSEKKSKKKGVE